MIFGPLRRRSARPTTSSAPDEPPTVRPAPPASAAADPRDAALTLAADLKVAVRRVNAAGGRLPVGAVPAVRAVEDVLRPLLTFVAAQSASVEAMHDLRGIIGEHLPGVVDHYLALPEHYAATATNAAGRTPADELLDALRLLGDGAGQLARAVYDRDAQALAVSRRFLDAKFARSDLDL